MPFQSDTPEGSDTFQWQLWEEIALAYLADEMGQVKNPMIHSLTDALEESEL